MKVSQEERKALAWCEKAERFEKQGMLAEAEKCLLKASRCSPNRAGVWYRLTKLERKRGRLRQALTFAKKVAPGSSWGYLCIAQTHLAAGRDSLAERFFRRSIQKKPRAVTYIFFGVFLSKKGRIQKGIQCFQQALKLEPQNEEAFYNLGITYHHLGRYEIAERHLRRAVEIDPKYALACAALAKLLNIMGRSKQAYRMYRKAAGVSGRRKPYYLGELYRMQDRKSGAVRMFRTSIRIDPEFGDAYGKLGALLLGMGKERVSEACRMLTKASALDPEAQSWKAYLTTALWMKGDVKAAGKLFRELMRKWPTNGFSVSRYGDFLASTTQNRSRAESFLRRGVELDPANAECNYLLGKRLLQWGRPKEARIFLRRASRKGHERARALLQRMLPLPADAIGAMSR